MIPWYGPPALKCWLKYVSFYIHIPAFVLYSLSRKKKGLWIFFSIAYHAKMHIFINSTLCRIVYHILLQCSKKIKGWTQCFIHLSAVLIVTLCCYWYHPYHGSGLHVPDMSLLSDKRIYLSWLKCLALYSHGLVISDSAF